jgi:hypothetical protein
MSLDTLRQAITTQIVDRIGSNWDEHFGELLAFKARHGHCIVPTEWPETPRLGAWVITQRYSTLTLLPERRERLNALGFVWDVSTAQWDEGFSALQSFHQREGHCRVPAAHHEQDYPLGAWVNTQRYATLTLLPERQQRLNALGFEWSIQATKKSAPRGRKPST